MAGYKQRGTQPMRVQARPGSPVEKRTYTRSALPSGAIAMPKAIAPGIDPSPLDDLMYHGGRVIPQSEFQNIYLGTSAAWREGDVVSIDDAIGRAMRDRRLENVMRQYFPGAAPSCSMRSSIFDPAPRPARIDENNIRTLLLAAYDAGRIAKRDLSTTLFNLILPSGSVLKLENDTSLQGLGGYHGSVHFSRASKRITLYYSANVYSEVRPNRRQNGIVAFDRPWKNVVGTLYHEINEFRTDPDVGDAIATGNNDFLGWTSRRGHEVGDQPIFVADDLRQVFAEVRPARGTRRLPIQFMYSNAVHGAEGPIEQPHR